MAKMLVAGMMTLGIALCLSTSVAQEGGPERPRKLERQNGLRSAEFAPSFVLKSLDGETETALASFRDKKPVVLIFGSYT